MLNDVSKRASNCQLGPLDHLQSAKRVLWLSNGLDPQNVFRIDRYLDFAAIRKFACEGDEHFKFAVNLAGSRPALPAPREASSLRALYQVVSKKGMRTELEFLRSICGRVSSKFAR